MDPYPITKRNLCLYASIRLLLIKATRFDSVIAYL